MAAPRKESLTKSREDVAALKPLPKNYGLRVDMHFPGLDLNRLHRMVAGRIEYPEGLAALKVICALYKAKAKQLQAA